MDTRKLRASLGVNGQANLYLEGRGIMATMEAGYGKVRHDDAKEIAKRWNAYPELVEAVRELIEAIDETLDPEAEGEFEGPDGDALKKYRALLASIEEKP